mgnify:CR=1 FL=1
MTNPLGHHNRGGKWCIHCGVTNGRISRAYADGKPLPCVRPDTSCGHPLAARAVVRSSVQPLRTVCWACVVEAV